MSNSAIKLLFYILITLLTIYPIVELLFKKHKWYINFFFITFILAFILIALKYKNVTDKEMDLANQKIEEANQESKKLMNALKVKSDSTNFYLNALKDSIKQVKSSNDNKKVFNNYIKKIETLNQY